MAEPGFERRLVFVAVGDHHVLHRDLRSDGSFDLIASFYGDSGAIRSDLVERGFKVVDGRGGKFQQLLAAHREDPAMLRRYDAVFVLDDDLGLSPHEICRLFDVRQEHDLWILQPSFDPRGRISYPSMRTRPGTSLRFTNFVEITAPLFRRQQLEAFLDVYDGSLVGWGTDHWYMNVLGENEPHRYAIVDEVSCLNPFNRTATGAREIDSLQPDSARHDAWERLRLERGLRTIVPSVSGGISRSRAGQLTAIARITELVLTDSVYRRRTRRVVRNHLSRAKRDLLTAVAVRRLRRRRRRGRLRRADVERARDAWGNRTWSAATGYVVACVDAARETDGPVVECGAGFSSSVLAVELERTGRRLITLEHDHDWAEFTKRRLRVAGIRNVQVLERPLRRRGDVDWYDVADEDLPDSVGLIVCDGPPGPTRGGRSGMLPALRRSIGDETVIIFDDVNRAEERATADEWAAELGFRVEISAADRSRGRQHAIIRRNTTRPSCLEPDEEAE